MYGFELSEEQRQMVDLAKRFAKERVIPVAAELDEKEKLPSEVFAQAPELVIGAANPMSGVFAFAGVEGFEGGRDHFEFVNKNGGVAGRRIRYVNEDSGYRVDNAVAIFTRITSQHQTPVFFGDSTGCLLYTSPSPRD